MSQGALHTTPKKLKPLGPEPNRYGRDGRLIRDQRHYQRSSCNNPFVSSPQYWEHPIGVATRTLPKTAFSPLAKPRPVNKRNYWSPSFWVQTVEHGDAPDSCTYLDYAFTDDFNRVWKDALKKEARFQQNAPKPRTRRPYDSASSSSRARPHSVTGGTFESEYRSSFAKNGFGQSLVESVCSKVSASPVSSQNQLTAEQILAQSRSAPALMSGSFH